MQGHLYPLRVVRKNRGKRAKFCVFRFLQSFFGGIKIAFLGRGDGEKFVTWLIQSKKRCLPTLNFQATLMQSERTP